MSAIKKNKRASLESDSSARELKEKQGKQIVKQRSTRASLESSDSTRVLDTNEKAGFSSAANRAMFGKRGSFESSNSNGNMGSSRLLETAEKASSEILSRLGFPDGVDGHSATSLDLTSVGLLSSYEGTSPSKNTRGVNNINYDSLHQIHVALGSRTIMAAPSLQDLCHDGETFAGTAADESVMLDWLAHIDSIIDNSLDADLDVDPFDMSTLLIRKSTLFCSLGRQDESVKCASAALDLVVTSLGLYRLACAHYMLTNYTEALEYILQANQLERYNTQIESTLLVILLRLRSRKDRPDAVIVS